MIRNFKPEWVTRFLGLDQFTPKESLSPAQFYDMLNCVVGPQGTVLPLRSPANLNDVLPIANTNTPVSVAYFDRDVANSGPIVLFDVKSPIDTSLLTYSTQGTTNTQLRQGATSAVAPSQRRFTSVNVANRLFRLNATEGFVQFQADSGLSLYGVGILAATNAPTVSFVAGGTNTVTVGLTVSYAYRNSVTTHVGNASAASASTGPTTTNYKLRVAVVASTEHPVGSLASVDGIVLFISKDGGSVRYLLLDGSGNTAVYANTTGNIDISIADIHLNTLIQETVINDFPPSGMTFLGKWKNRLVGMLGRDIAYSGQDKIDIGFPQECWPPLNRITSPNRGEILKSSLETQIGLLVLSDRDGYLATGALSDNLPASNVPLQFTEVFRQLGWAMGTRSPLSLQNTPFGAVWLDQNLRFRLWNQQGLPIEIAEGLRQQLDGLYLDDTSLSLAEGKWFDSGKYGGFYVLTGSTNGTTNDRLFIIGIFRNGGSIWTAAGVSSIAAQCVEVAKLSSTWKCLIGVPSRLRRILDFDNAGAGWASTDKIYVEVITGNTVGTRFNRLHSISVDGTLLDDIAVEVRDMEDDNIEAVGIEKEDASWFGVVNRYGVRQKLRFTFPLDDTNQREIRKLGLAYTLSGRQV